MRIKFARAYAWINFGAQLFSFGYFVGTHQYIWLGIAQTIFAISTAMFIMRRTTPRLTVTVRSRPNPILPEKAVVIIDADFELVKS